MTLRTPEQLALEEKASLTAGTDLWHTAAVERLGIPALRLTDGPSGARGERWSSGGSACFPSGSALGATWNPRLVRRVGQALAEEARAKGAQVLLAPTVNIHRHPLNGRHFECYSEDPLLTSELSTAYVEGVQERGIAAVVKHFVCNDQEFERLTINVEVDERTLREIYLPPFESAVHRAHVWALMGAYNKLHGVYCCEHPWLLVDLLKTEWGFDGLVMSDWHATHSTGAVAAGLDLEMPGPAQYLGHHLVGAVQRGDVAESALDDAVARFLRLATRVSTTRDGAPGALEPGALAREAAGEAIVLLKNDAVGGAPLLPLDARKLRKVALIGPMINRPAVQGGGSAEVTPAYVVGPREGLHQRFGERLEITEARGCNLPGLLPVIDPTLRHGPMRVEYFANPDFQGAPVVHEEFVNSRMFWTGAPAPGVPAGPFSARMRTTFVPNATATWRFGLANAGQARLLLNRELLLDNFDPVPGDTFFGRGSTQVTADVDLTDGVEYELAAEYRTTVEAPMAGMRIGADALLPADSIDRAAQMAAEADVALVVVGYDGLWEGESFDRPHMDLPGDQDALIRAVVAANSRTVVVLNTGSPVHMDWADEVPALLQLWFPGMELGNALMDVLFGDVNPSGHLPTSFPRALSDTPAFHNYPGENGVVRYAEGVFVGYRHYDTRGVEPRFCFGHGLSYTRFEFSNLRAIAQGEAVRVSFEASNTGERDGQAVVQVYVRDVESSIERPDKQLGAFEKVALAAGEKRTVEVMLPRRAFAYWSVEAHGWVVEPGEFEILVGASSRDIRGSVRIRL
ncbi:MAG: glycoside hydrolase family 3 C-terminal domain-containing protein [Chloroflexi bacterium]|nr:glycoside hydrolase family 3 C-terminal domain-containing protein [Chloroflexota bacterium]